MIYIYAIQMEPPGTEHGHIAAVKWKNPDTGESKESTRAEMVKKISDENVAAYVCGDHAHIARVGVVKVNGEPTYIRTHADGDWNDNLLALPRY